MTNRGQVWGYGCVWVSDHRPFWECVGGIPQGGVLEGRSQVWRDRFPRINDDSPIWQRVRCTFEIRVLECCCKAGGGRLLLFGVNHNGPIREGVGGTA